MASAATNGNIIHQDQVASSSPAANDHNSGSTGSDLSKDEVGWYFVEQYYNTLSKNPERLHLFYGKTSQFVYGLEAELSSVSVGRQAIQERIKSLDLQDCKVRVSNVDSQASDESIVIQVIGETVNKGGDPKKFVQTFVLAKQPSGYFVLNDILRYINDDAEEETAETGAPEEAVNTEAEVAAEPEPVEPEVAATEMEESEEKVAAQPQLDATVVDKKLEEAGVNTKETPSTSVVSTPAETVAPAEDVAAAPAPKEESTPEPVPEPEKIAQEIAEEDVKKAETPKDPSPTPAAPRGPAPLAASPTPATAEPEKPKEPPKPVTWASRLAAAAGPPRPAVALPKPVIPTAAPTPRPAAPGAATSQPAAAAPAPAAETAVKDAGNEWQTAGADSKRQNRPQSVPAPSQEKEGTLGYVKYVTEKVKAESLRAALASYGELVYFDINRSKNCAFVEFAAPAGYQAAAAANPHVVDGESIFVEPRRPKAGAYGGSNYSNRGSISGRGRGGYEGSRSGSQGSRGGFTGQSRGGRGGGAPRGRGVSQATNA